jgi:hypothetical protein
MAASGGDFSGEKSNHRRREMSLQRRFAERSFFGDYCAYLFIFEGSSNE